MPGEAKKAVMLGSAELDRIVGGVPIPSLNLIEGENDSGKSVFVQQLASGALAQGLKVRYVTTETTVKSLVQQMDSLGFNTTPYFVKGVFAVTAIHVKGISWDESVAKNFLHVILSFVKNRGDADVVVMDSLTYIATHTPTTDLLSFLSELRNYVDIRGRLVAITLHPFAFEKELLIRIRSVCDGHVNFSIKILPSKEIARSLEITKLKGADRAQDNAACFKVEPGVGIRVLPFSAVKA